MLLMSTRHRWLSCLAPGWRATGCRLAACAAFANCDENERAGATCVFPAHDLGIAVGSAASIAAHHHVDNRAMFSNGVAALRLGLMGEG